MELNEGGIMNIYKEVSLKFWKKVKKNLKLVFKSPGLYNFEYFSNIDISQESRKARKWLLLFTFLTGFHLIFKVDINSFLMKQHIFIKSLDYVDVIILLELILIYLLFNFNIHVGRDLFRNVIKLEAEKISNSNFETTENHLIREFEKSLKDFSDEYTHLRVEYDHNVTNKNLEAEYSYFQRGLKKKLRTMGKVVKQIMVHEYAIGRVAAKTFFNLYYAILPGKISKIGKVLDEESNFFSQRIKRIEDMKGKSNSTIKVFLYYFPMLFTIMVIFWGSYLVARIYLLDK